MKKKHIAFLIIIFTVILCSFSFNTYAYNYKAVYKTTDNPKITKYGFADKNGNIIIDYIYDYACNFNDGIAFVSKNGKTYFINSSGSVAFRSASMPYTCIEPFSCGRALICQNNKYGFINMSGRITIAAEYDNALSFSEGLSAVCKNGKYGFIDTKGNIVIDFIYDNAYSFKDGAARIKLNGKYGFINTQGEKITNIVYDRVSNFSEGLAVVKINENYGVIDKNENYTVAPIYEWISDFNNGIAIVKQNGLFGCIDKNANLLTSIKYTSLQRPTDGFIICSVTDYHNTELFGVTDKYENIVIPFAYSEINYMGNNVFSVCQLYGKLGVINNKNRVLVPLKYDKITKNGDNITAELNTNIYDFTITPQ